MKYLIALLFMLASAVLDMDTKISWRSVLDRACYSMGVIFLYQAITQS